MKLRLLFLGIFAASLSACVPAALVVGATAGGAIVYDNRSIKTMAKDKESELQADLKLRQDSQLKTAHIDATTFNQIMLLVGQAPTAEISQRAYDVVSRIPNIKRIYNEITIGQPTSLARRSQDTWITTKVKTKMLAEKGLHSTQIKVVTENGVVYLMGLVTRSQGNLAAEVASRISGVQKVVKLFEYLN
jgi:osmotically-inducible protein OsmY